MIPSYFIIEILGKRPINQNRPINPKRPINRPRERVIAVCKIFFFFITN